MSIAKRSWQAQELGLPLEATPLYRESLMSAAKLGCLRAYLLEGGETPCAFSIGYQHGDVLQIQQTAYAQDWRAFSPGIVLYHLIMEDLHRHRPPRLINFGVGVNPQKRLFTNRRSFDTEIFLFRPTLRNRLRVSSIAAFSGGFKLAKRFLRKRSPIESPEDVE
jgi:CelD/BcsL family acetyltransferase involved in cellulose biosynthesis